MKSVRFIIIVLAFAFAGPVTYAQTHDHSSKTASKTETFKVGGACDMCKARIEKAAKIEGVSKAEWNKETKVLTLVFNPSVVTSDAVQKQIAVVGHDTPKFKADDSVYNKLPACCHYERLD